jgi:hypothetical protein
VDLLVLEVEVIRQLPETDTLQVPARLPPSWWTRHPGGLWAPIFKSLSRVVPQVALANRVWRRPIRRSASSRT